jgi:hypothetical protein
MHNKKCTYILLHGSVVKCNLFVNIDLSDNEEVKNKIYENHFY